MWDGGGFDIIDLLKFFDLELVDFIYDYCIDLREGGLIIIIDVYN